MNFQKKKILAYSIDRMTSHTFYTQTITSDGSGLALVDSVKAGAPYITYKCKAPVNLNFLFREVLFCDPESFSVAVDDPTTGRDKVRLVKTYADVTTAEAASDAERIADVSETHGSSYAMRLINAIMRNELQVTDTNLVSKAIHFAGYDDGLVSGTSVNSTSANTATMDFSEFFQVALSAIRNKETDAVVSGSKGLTDRENINNAAIVDDLKSRSTENVLASDLVATLLRSATKPNTFSNGVIDNSSEVNWLKQILYSIIIQSTGNDGSVADAEGTERYMPIRRTAFKAAGGNQQERFMQLCLKDGDSIVVVFKFSLSKTDGTLVDTDCPDAAGTPMTIGFKIEHADFAGDYILSSTGSGSALPLGWDYTDEILNKTSSLSASDSLATTIGADAKLPVSHANGGWAYTNPASDTLRKINWYLFSDANKYMFSSMDCFYVRMVVAAGSKVPWLTCYSAKQNDGLDAASWYRSRWNMSGYYEEGGNNVPKDQEIIMYFGSKVPSAVFSRISSSIPVLDVLNHNAAGVITNRGPRGSSELLLSVALSTDSSASADSYNLRIIEAGYRIKGNVPVCYVFN